MDSDQTNECAECTKIHALLDADPSGIVRNTKDSYPEGHPPQELTLLERVEALCRYAADWKRWFEEAQIKEDTRQGCICHMCGKTAHEIKGWLARVNEFGVTGIWECRPTCNKAQPQHNASSDGL